MPKITIVLYQKSFDFDKRSFIIGGMETYVQDIAKLALSKDYQVIFLLPTTIEYNVIFDGINVVGIKTNNIQKVCDFAIKMIDSPRDRVIIGSEQFSIKALHPQVIAIQHGIGWDAPTDFLGKIEKSSVFLCRLMKTLRCWRHIYKFNGFSNVVCVDYNYVNWYRTIDDIFHKNKIAVIPNYTSTLLDRERINSKLNDRSNINIIFARRFVDYRGAKMFVNISKRLLLEYDNITITFAGDGPLKSYIEQTFMGDRRVSVTSFKPADSVEFHFKYDIAVVPTIFSEGTSLSLCEAMAAGCLPVVTFVGGMSNMILDGYNGLLSYPSEEEFYKVMVKALNMPKRKFDSMVINAIDSVETSFSIERWREKWSEVLGLDL